MLFGNCIIVKGYHESIICDLEKGRFLPTSNKILDVIKVNETNRLPITEIKNHYNNKFDNGIDVLFDYLIKQGYGFFTKTPDFFPKISLEWDSPFPLTNSVIEIEKDSLSLGINGIMQIVKIGCQAIEIRLLSDIDINSIKKILDIINASRTSCVYLIIKYNPKINSDFLTELYLKWDFISSIVVHTAPKIEKISKSLPDDLKERITIKNTKLYGEKVLSKLNPIMVINLDSFTEAINYNLGLNRKLSINSKGEIKNYLNHKKVFGNIFCDKIEEILDSHTFIEKWFVTKDQIAICKDCQYRYFCMDNSDLIVKKGHYHRITKCNFNPYKNTWDS